MKTTKFLSIVLVFLLMGPLKGYSQVTTASNTITATDFLGSSNGFPIVFKVNNTSAGTISSSFLYLGQYSFAGGNSTSMGQSAGQYCTTGLLSSVYIGQQSGRGTITTANSGYFNTCVGNGTGNQNSTGSYNAFFGGSAGYNNTTGSNNTYVGISSGGTNQTGTNNTFLGKQSGFNNTSGSSNVFLGYQAGYSETGSDKLYIDNSNTATPLVWGDFSNDQLKFNGKVGIGAVTTFPSTAGGASVSNYKLFVTGGILTDEVRVNLSSSGTWADYVFHKDYNLKPLSEVESFIKDNGHLPNVPSAAQIKEEGIALGEMAKIQQEKIEELTLYIIAQNKRIEALEAKLNNK